MSRKFKCVPIEGNSNYVVKVYCQHEKRINEELAKPETGFGWQRRDRIDYSKMAMQETHKIIDENQTGVENIRDYIYYENKILENTPWNESAFKNMLLTTISVIATATIFDLIFSLQEHEILMMFLLMGGSSATLGSMKEAWKQNDTTKRRKALQNAIETLKKFEFEQLGQEKEGASKTK